MCFDSFKRKQFFLCIYQSGFRLWHPTKQLVFQKSPYKNFLTCKGLLMSLIIIFFFKKCCAIGFSFLTLEWFKYYLTNRTFGVNVWKLHLSPYKILSEKPKGPISSSHFNLSHLCQWHMLGVQIRPMFIKWKTYILFLSTKMLEKKQGESLAWIFRKFLMVC